MEAPLHQLPVSLPQDHALLQQAVAARALIMAAAAGNNAPSAGPGREQCPRCASRDTKFCYYNNYNTAQPRHFCRACRRYWTLGGSLRNVPVGGASRKRPRRPARRPIGAMAAAVAAMATPAASGGSPFAASPAATLLQGAAGGGGGLLLSSLLLAGSVSASPSPSPLLAFGTAAPLLEGRLGFDLGLGFGDAADTAAGDLGHRQTLPLASAGGPFPWPAATTTILDGDRAETTTTTCKDASSVFPFPPPAALWPELAAAAPAVEAGGLHHGGATHLLL